MITRRAAAVVLACWASWPLGVIASIWAWDSRPGLTGFVLALAATTWAAIAYDHDKRTAEKIKDAQS